MHSIHMNDNALIQNPDLNLKYNIIYFNLNFRWGKHDHEAAGS